MVGLEKVEDPEEIAALEAMIQKHRTYTQSKKAAKVLALWEEIVPKFVKVMPKDYKRVLGALKKAEQDGLSGDAALNAAFEANARDVARIGGG
jgi:glutamate synthase (ferredoxin)